MALATKKRLRVLGIETSCDETSVAILEVENNDAKIVHHETASQVPVHAIYGGVVPEVAARLHVAETIALLDRALGEEDGKGKREDGKGNGKAESGLAPAYDMSRFDAIAVTQGPGLATALRVGIEAARMLAMVGDKPIVGVNHLEGHLASAWLMEENRKAWKFPILALLVSGGHTELVLMEDFCQYRVLGRTLDDAAGEAFDKTAKLMGLGYPGGPVISKLAEPGDPKAFDIPRPMTQSGDLNFSFSGLKTAVRRIWEEMPAVRRVHEKTVADLCASIQEAIVEVLVIKTLAAVEAHKPRAVCLVGGVSANGHLQEVMRRRLANHAPEVAMLHAARGLHTDNAAMIAAAGAWRLKRGEKHDWRTLDAEPELDLS